MFSGFVTTYRDSLNKVHLFFFPGLDQSGNLIYKSLDLSKTGVKYEAKKYEDSSEEFIFDREDITKINCKLADKNGNIKNVELTID